MSNPAANVLGPTPYHPLLTNPVTGEPFLRLPSPNENIIVTPLRRNDPDSIARTISILNEPSVYMNLTGPPFPYTQQDAEEWIEARVPESDDILKDLKEHFEGSVGREENVPVGPTGLKLVEGCPLSVIREVREDGTDIYIGSIGLIRSKFFDIVDPVEKEQAIQENDARPLGDPDIIRSFGDFLAPSHHGKGIMTAVIRTLIDNWVIPRMGAQKMIVTALKGNIASVRVFEKNGFVLRYTIDEAIRHMESKGGQAYGLHVLDWNVEDYRRKIHQV